MRQRVYLLRHGQTEWSANGRHTSRTDLPLTEHGVDQARRAGQTLSALRDQHAALVLSSPRQRARKTAELAGLSVDEVTEELAEWNYGDYEGRTTEDIRRTVPDWTVWSGPIPDGENADEVGARADRLLARIRDLLRETEVILVGHGHFSRVLVARWLGLPVSSGVHFGLEPGSISVLGDERGAPQVKHLNLPPS